MSEETVKTTVALKVVFPLNGHILLKKDPDKERTQGGIILPEESKLTVLSGRVLAIASDIEDCPIKKYDKVIVNPERAFPVDPEQPDLYLLPYRGVLGVFRGTDDEAGHE
jgi:co-chaperonin GroES (HSP10)